MPPFKSVGRTFVIDTNFPLGKKGVAFRVRNQQQITVVSGELTADQAFDLVQGGRIELTCGVLEWDHSHYQNRLAEQERAYRSLADQVIKWFNPPDGDEAEEEICSEAIKRAAQFIESVPCTCEEGAGFPDFTVDPCERCRALGRAEDQEIER